MQVLGCASEDPESQQGSQIVLGDVSGNATDRVVSLGRPAFAQRASGTTTVDAPFLFQEELLIWPGVVCPELALGVELVLADGLREARIVQECPEYAFLGFHANLTGDYTNNSDVDPLVKDWIEFVVGFVVVVTAVGILGVLVWRDLGRNGE
jgi:hypothetical protein